ncbi:MAG: nodulation protein NodH [Arenibacterium sp.]
MEQPFDYFVVFAEMRTGSNFLETNLNAFDGLSCHGEAFNPHFIGYPNRKELLGVRHHERDENPLRLIGAVKGAPDLAGFRYFHDHDPRVLEPVLDDPKCAKIILTRNPLDSYVSWKIAKATNQWKLTDVKRRKDARAKFDAEEFSDYVAVLQGFQVNLLNQLQRRGQVPFYLTYEDLQDLDVMNGLARWLGIREPLSSLDRSLKVQNPGSVAEKVTNPDDMKRAVAELDRFNLTRTPNFEPRRGAAVPSYIGAVETPLLFMPVTGGPVTEIRNWLAKLDGVSPDQLHVKMNQKNLRSWKRSMSGHRSFTVIRHPALRAHQVFCQRILSTGPGSYLKIRDTLRRQFNIPLPEKGPEADYSLAQHREAFEAFLTFLKANLALQTPIRVDAAWCSQSIVLSSFADFILPDHVFREEELPEMLPALAERVGVKEVEPPEQAAHDAPFALGDIYDDALEALIANVYSRDYAMFGFGRWAE